MLTEYIKLALRSMWGSLLRTVLTLGIIAVGIAALIAILTAIDSIKVSMTSNFSSMGANSFTIQNQATVVGHDQRADDFPPIEEAQALEFMERFQFPAEVAMSARVSFSAALVKDDKETNPNVTVFAVDEYYVPVAGYNIAEGRNLSKWEIESGSYSVIIGTDVAGKLFEEWDTIVGSQISIGNIKYTVAGVLESRGSSQVTSDNMIMIPYTNAQRHYPSKNTSYTMVVSVNDPEDLDYAVEEAKGLFRAVRKVKVGEDDNFAIERSDKLAEELISQLGFLSIATIVIGLLTLLGAGIGLMNIMLVSVNERTREIGVSKAIGARDNAIMLQFLTEAILICLIGGGLGIVLGIGLGNVVSILLKSSFVVPWGWIIGGIVFCFMIGLLAGLYPAIKASNLDPIEALRAE